MNKHESQRVAILMDAENLEITTATLFGTKVNYNKLMQKINDRKVVRAIYYTKVQKLFGNDGKVLNSCQGFVNFLKNSQGIEIRTAPKNVDCWLTVDAISIASKVDVVVLIGGDGDYAPLLWYLRALGVKTEVWMWEERTASSLKESADQFVALDNKYLLNANK